jgi:hypothetical protein
MKGCHGSSCLAESTISFVTELRHWQEHNDASWKALRCLCMSCGPLFSCQVDGDFNAIFSTLLPGTAARLTPPEGGTFLDGLEVSGQQICRS